MDKSFSYLKMLFNDERSLMVFTDQIVIEAEYFVDKSEVLSQIELVERFCKTAKERINNERNTVLHSDRQPDAGDTNGCGV